MLLILVEISIEYALGLVKGGTTVSPEGGTTVSPQGGLPYPPRDRVSIRPLIYHMARCTPDS